MGSKTACEGNDANVWPYGKKSQAGACSTAKSDLRMVDNEEKTRRVFAQAKKLNDRLGFKNLSAGMSNDWKIAIEEGANFLRVGRRFFKQTIEIT